MWLNQFKLGDQILEVNYGDSLDKIFVLFHNALQFDNLLNLIAFIAIDKITIKWKSLD